MRASVTSLLNGNGKSSYGFYVNTKD